MPPFCAAKSNFKGTMVLAKSIEKMEKEARMVISTVPALPELEKPTEGSEDGATPPLGRATQKCADSLSRQKILDICKLIPRMTFIIADPNAPARGTQKTSCTQLGIQRYKWNLSKKRHSVAVSNLNRRTQRSDLLVTGK